MHRNQNLPVNAPPHGVALAGALLAALSVALGAFGAHALEGQITAERLAAWQTACDYLGWQAAALIGLGALFAGQPALAERPLLNRSAALVLIGTMLFSGSLFALVLSDVRLLGAITPFGGLAMIGGWIGIAVGLWRARRRAESST